MTSFIQRAQAIIEESGKPLVGIGAVDIQTGEELFLDPDRSFHAASTMKAPVMMETYRQGLDPDSTVLVKNQFASIVDGSPYSLQEEDDSDKTLYQVLGQEVPIRTLVELMIVASSNLATNLLIDLVGAARTSRFMAELGAPGLKVLRGVEDGKAFAKGLNNTVTARGLATIFQALARGKVVSSSASNEMLEILSRQEHNEAIPQGLPPGTRVAHKTGWNNDVYHDAGVVYRGLEPSYVLVVLTKGARSMESAHKLVAEIAKASFEG